MKCYKIQRSNFMRSTKLLFWFNKLFICSTKLYYILSQVTFWLCVQVTNSKNLSLHFPNTGDHQFWQGGNLPVEEPTYLVRWPFDHVVTWQMNKFYVWTYTVPRTTKLNRVVTCDGKTPTSMSCDFLILWSRDKWKKKLYLNFHNTYGRKTLQSRNLRLVDPIH